MPTLVIYDFETTGLKAVKDGKPHHEAVQIGAIALDTLTLTELGSFSSYIRPLRPELASAEALEINQLTLEKLSTEPSAAIVAGNFRRWIKDYSKPMPSGWNLGFDEGFMQQFCPGIGWNFRKLDVMALAVAHLLLPGRTENVKLGTVASFFFPDELWNAHDALEDVRMTARILRRFTQKRQKTDA